MKNMAKKIGEWSKIAVKRIHGQRGIGTLEMLLIIALILIVAVAFRKWIMAWVDNLFQTTNDNVNDTLDDNTIELPN